MDCAISGFLQKSFHIFLSRYTNLEFGCRIYSDCRTCSQYPVGKFVGLGFGTRRNSMYVLCQHSYPSQVCHMIYLQCFLARVCDITCQIGFDGNFKYPESSFSIFFILIWHFLLFWFEKRSKQHHQFGHTLIKSSPYVPITDISLICTLSCIILGERCLRISALTLFQYIIHFLQRPWIWHLIFRHAAWKRERERRLISRDR